MTAAPASAPATAVQSRLVPAALLERQAKAILTAWGLPEAQAEATAALLVEAELAGIESHGVGLLVLYRDLLAAGRVVPGGEPSVAVDRGAMATGSR
jgi:LDH2 family malate/lactate/ureidoglycolate dehydrogenase